MSSHASSTGSNPWRLEPGTVIEGRYQIVRVLGEGGFATVYEARHTRIDSLVAIKVLRIDHTASDKDFVQRFLDEAKATASIRHPNIVAVHDFGLLPETGQPFIAMQRLVGHDLKQELRSNGPLDAPRAFRLFKGALAALGQAHSMGIIHKDLKPANLFLSEPNTPNEALVVMDFGIARVESAGSKTGTGNFLGTPQYYAPEYIRHQIVTPSLDVYQMGLILIEMFTGKPVVNTNDPFQCLHDHCTGSLSLPAFVMESPLGHILRQALRLNHQERFRDGYEFMAILESIDPHSLNFEVSASGNGAVAPMLNPETGHGMPMHSNQHFQAGVGQSQPVPVAVGSAASYASSPSGSFGQSGQASYPQAGPMFTGPQPGVSLPNAPVAAPPTPAKSSPVLMAIAAALILLLLGGGAAAFFILQTSDEPPPSNPPELATVVENSAPTPVEETVGVNSKKDSEDSKLSLKEDGKSNGEGDGKTDEAPPANTGVGPCTGAVSPPSDAVTITVTFETLPTGASIINQGALLGKTPCTWTRTAQDTPLKLELRDPDKGTSIPVQVDLRKSNTVSVDLKNPPAPTKPIAKQKPNGQAWKKRGPGNNPAKLKGGEKSNGGDSGGGGGGAIGRERD